jgi:hypothetical protein
LLIQWKIQKLMLIPFHMAAMVPVLGQKFPDCEAPRPEGSSELFYRRSAAAARFVETFKRLRTRCAPNLEKLSLQPSFGEFPNNFQEAVDFGFNP